jgi:hypothetical protein
MEKQTPVVVNDTANRMIPVFVGGTAVKIPAGKIIFDTDLVLFCNDVVVYEIAVLDIDGNAFEPAETTLMTKPADESFALKSGKTYTFSSEVIAERM